MEEELLMKKISRFSGALLFPMLASCAATGPQESLAPSRQSEIAGTQWVLIGYIDDGPSTDLHEVPLYKYTLRFDASDTAKLKLDCNLGGATWRAASIAKGKGSLSFGPVNATMALCPEGSMGESLASDLSRVTGYTLYDGRLSLIASGSRTYVWDTID
jgi:hypothetical protein